MHIHTLLILFRSYTLTYVEVTLYTLSNEYASDEKI